MLQRWMASNDAQFSDALAEPLARAGGGTAAVGGRRAQGERREYRRPRASSSRGSSPCDFDLSATTMRLLLPRSSRYCYFAK